MQINQTVYCPSDRGIPAYAGRIEHIGTDIQTNIHGVNFVWITVRRTNGAHENTAHVWPSHRLGFRIK